MRRVKHHDNLEDLTGSDAIIKVVQGADVGNLAQNLKIARENTGIAIGRG